MVCVPVCAPTTKNIIIDQGLKEIFILKREVVEGR
jgi:hypothetical protein